MGREARSSCPFSPRLSIAGRGGPALPCKRPAIRSRVAAEDARMLNYLAPGTIRRPFARYSHGVEVPPGSRLVLCSGQLGIAADDTVAADAQAQTERCFANVAAILAEA